MAKQNSPTGGTQGTDEGVTGSPADAAPTAARDPFAALNVSPEREARIREVVRELGLSKDLRVVEVPARPSSPVVRAAAFLAPVIVVGLVLYLSSDQWLAPRDHSLTPATGGPPPSALRSPSADVAPTGLPSPTAPPAAKSAPEVASGAPPAAESTPRPIPPFAFSPPAEPSAPAASPPPLLRTIEAASRSPARGSGYPPPPASVEASPPHPSRRGAEVIARPEPGPASVTLAVPAELPREPPNPKDYAPVGPTPPSQPQQATAPVAATPAQQPGTTPSAAQRPAYPPQYPPPYGWTPQPYYYGYPSSGQSR
jgi:hypothetical protein